MSEGTYTRAVVTDVDGFTIIPLAPEAEPAYVDGEGGTTLFAHGPDIPAYEFERFFGIYSSGGVDALAVELKARGFKGCSERDGELVAWEADGGGS